SRPWLGRSKAKVVHALNDVSLSLQRGQTLAIVGESGCGKSTLARCLSGVITPTAGRFSIGDESAADMLRKDPMRFHRTVQMVFQDPFSSINPRRRIVDIIGDALRLHSICPARQRKDKVAELLHDVGLADDHLNRLPHELSGGQRQRVAIARALAVNPAVVICDEPVSALDVSVQAQVINLLRDIQKKRGVAYVFISHNLALVEHIADEIAVMYLGQVVETAPRQRGTAFLHPYSRMLFDAAPQIGHPFNAEAARNDAEVPSPLDLPPGCHFNTRCAYRQAQCDTDAPQLRDCRPHAVRCHFDL
ncbi:MAG TPA: oligopeptide/dipeptide ABC transporter ATP-binding protein, partial [Burkholderiaceae bacterium]